MRITEKENMELDKHIEYLKYAVSNNCGLQSHGFIYKVENGFRAKLLDAIYIKDGVVLSKDFNTADLTTYKEKYIEAGSLIEFRYECDAHCRDTQDDYWVIDASILALKCTPYAKIKDSIRFENKLTLSEILNNKNNYELLNGVEK